MYFQHTRDWVIERLRQRRSLLQLIKDRLALPFLLVMSSDAAQRAGLTPLDAERLILAFPVLKGRLLDIGCGDNILVRAYGQGIGVDVVDWGDVDLVVPSAAQLPFADETFDTVTLLATLNHIPDRESVLTELYRLLRPGGQILVSMISPPVSWLVHRIRYHLDPDQHQRGISAQEVWGFWPREIRQLLQKAGFTLGGTRSCVFGLNRLYIGQKPQRPQSPEPG